MADLASALLSGTRKKKFHELLAEQSMSTAPTPSWGAALARALQGGIAGMIEGREDQQQRETLPAIMEILQGSGGQSSPQASSSAPAPLATALSRPADPVNADAVTEAKTPQDYINRAWGGVTPQGRDVATRTVLGEAANQGPVGMAGVADVMRNRAASGGYGGETMDKVALAKGQFEPWMTAGGRNRMASFSPTGQPYKNAQAAVDTAAIGSRPDVTGGAEYFYAPKAQAQLAPVDGRPATPSFAAGRQPTAVIGDHNFYAPKTQVAQNGMDAQAQSGNPQLQPVQQPRTLGLSPEQSAQLNTMLRHPNPRVREYGASVAAQAVANQFKPADYDIKVEGGVVIATNKRNPTDTQVINNPTIAAAITRNKAAEAGATERAKITAARDSGESPGQKAIDQTFAKEYAEYSAAGGFADVQKQSGQLRSVIERLNDKTKPAVTGPIVGQVADAINAFNNPDAIATRERVEEVAQRNLRSVLGGQFAQMEGAQLIKRAYNPLLPPEENAKRVNSLMAAINNAAEQKARAAEYFERNGTLAGFQGKLPSMSSISSDFDASIGDKGEQSFTPPPDWEFSKSRGQYRDPQGNIYDKNGKPVK
jgi:spore germination cell wall hydrolase CwlJ-like protein